MHFKVFILSLFCMVFTYLGCASTKPLPLHIQSVDAPVYALGKEGSAQLFINASRGIKHAAINSLIMKSGVKIPLHKHPKSDEIIVLLEGKVEMIMGQNTYQLEKNDVIFIPRGMMHAALITSKENMRAIQIYTPGGPEERFRTGLPLFKPFPSQLIIDGHIDLPYRLFKALKDKDPKEYNRIFAHHIIQSDSLGDFDFHKGKEGGLSAPFMSIYIPAKIAEEGGGKKHADYLIDLVERMAKDYPQKFALVDSPKGVEEAYAHGLIALSLGMENGSGINNKLANIDHFYKRGIRYITLTHSRDNEICDSSYDTRHSWQGLSPFGRKVVAKMNEKGMMIDISHVSDQAFWHVIELSQAPIIASHSSCRHFTPGFERNMNDKMIKVLAQKGGIIMINFGSGFLLPEAQHFWKKREKAIVDFMKEKNIKKRKNQVAAFKKEYMQNNPYPKATIKDVIKHIKHVVKIAGIDAVGLGSDFDGVGDTLPLGLEKASKMPALIEALKQEGFSDEAISKICSKNILRVWRQVEHIASTLQKQG